MGYRVLQSRLDRDKFNHSIPSRSWGTAKRSGQNWRFCRLRPRQLVRAPFDRDQPQAAVCDDGDQQRAQGELEALAAGNSGCSVVQSENSVYDPGIN